MFEWKVHTLKPYAMGRKEKKHLSAMEKRSERFLYPRRYKE